MQQTLCKFTQIMLHFKHEVHSWHTELHLQAFESYFTHLGAEKKIRIHLITANRVGFPVVRLLWEVQAMLL